MFAPGDARLTGADTGVDKRTKAATFFLLAVFTLVVSSAAQERVRDEQGEFEYLAAANGVLITAPHGTYDINTAPLAIAVAGRLGAGYIVFRGSTAAGARINVNRPTEGAGRSCPNEPHTDRARATYETYIRLVRAAAGGDRLRLYVEIHGNADPRTAQNIEIASKGVSAAEALAMKERYPAALSAVQREWLTFPALQLLVEPVDRVFFTASCAKMLGILATDLLPRVLHVEFPRAVRESDMLEATGALTVDLLKRFLGSP